ncbi:vWA domain-containing protein [Candidatus Formimonas warabiya]|uniref:VWA domain-containing protein n=1 Tax=Formimonas warabiya TaxID=1761012 RepID=A0A3G1KV35_FORW1|nr:VWA domain-containing protein [Candidatus Formimonas warabiya]ATW26301.1 hypothetical protein DCMF_17410 [Candidatus Formimonas warabiya]
MEKRLLEFVNSLRSAGVRISPGEIVDCLEALKSYGIAEHRLFYRLLKATLIKSETDTPLFDLAFRLYFQEEVEKPEPLTSPGCCDGFASGVDGSGTGKAGMGAASRQLYHAIQEGQSQILISLAEKQLAQLTVGEEGIDQLLHQIKVSMEWFMVENAFEREGKEGEENAGILKDLEQYLRHRIEKLAVAQKGEQGLSDILWEENLKQKDLGALNEVQVKEMEKRVERLANKLASRYSYRFKPAKSGRVDMRRVLQKAARMGRTPERLFYQDKVMDRPRIVVLCDISGSVAVYSAFLLQLVYAMARRFADLRTFLFVDEIAEVTLPLKTGPVQDAVRQALQEARCSRLGISNFGQVFELFRLHYGEILHPKTTLVILGDAKNNWYPPRKEELRTISEQVHRIIWLNPEPKAKWNQDDSIIGLYGQSCSDVIECRNLDQLEQAVRKIV